MKSLFYVLALATIGTSGFFGWTAKKNFEKQVDDRNSLIDQNKNLSNSIAREEETKVKNTAQKKVALAEESEAKAGLEASQAKARERTNTLDSIKGNLEIQLAEKKKIDDTISAIRAKFPGINLEEVPVKVKELEATVKRLDAAREDSEVIKAGLESDVAKNRAEIARLSDKIDDSIRRVSGNVFQATITAVDNNYNFCIIGAGEKSGLTGDSKLLVLREGRLIAKLFISKLEANSAIGDLEPESLRSGVVIRPGDQVILAKVRSN
ncbi:MAG: hypothetical protein ACON4R_13780 [Akkermansiaceae bacterium]